jgi:hypothetical protein
MHLLVSTHSTPIAVVEIDSSCAVNRIHTTQFWETALSTLAGFIECGNGFGLQMGASTLVVHYILTLKIHISATICNDVIFLFDIHLHFHLPLYRKRWFFHISGF